MTTWQGGRQRRWLACVHFSEWPFWLVCLLYALVCWLVAHFLLDAIPGREMINSTGRFSSGAAGVIRDASGNIVAHPFKTGLALERGSVWPR
jgi:hypothetical protein